MWNNYTVEMQNPGRVEDHLAEARANALEAEARAADPHTSRLAAIVRYGSAASTRRAAAVRRSAARRATIARRAATTRLHAARHRVALAAVQLRHPHPPATGHHRA